MVIIGQTREDFRGCADDFDFIHAERLLAGVGRIRGEQFLHPFLCPKRRGKKCLQHSRHSLPWGCSQVSANRDFKDIPRQPKGLANMASPMTGEDPKALTRFRVFRFDEESERTSRGDRDCVEPLFGAARGQKTPRRVRKETFSVDFLFGVAVSFFTFRLSFPSFSKGGGLGGGFLSRLWFFPLRIL